MQAFVHMQRIPLAFPNIVYCSIFSIFRPTPNDSISADSPMKQPRTKNAVLAQQVSRSKRANSKTVGENIGGEIFQPKWIRKAYQRNSTHSVALLSAHVRHNTQ